MMNNFNKLQMMKFMVTKQALVQVLCFTRG